MTSQTLTPQTLNRMLNRYEIFRPSLLEQIILKFKGKLRARNCRLMHDLAEIAQNGPNLNLQNNRRITDSAAFSKSELSDEEFAAALIKALDIKKENENELRFL